MTNKNTNTDTNSNTNASNNIDLDIKFLSGILNEVGEALASFTEEEPEKDWFFKDSSGGWKEWHKAT